MASRAKPPATEAKPQKPAQPQPVQPSEPVSVDRRLAWLDRMRPFRARRDRDVTIEVTIRSLDVVKVDAENNLLLVKGAVPGANEGLLLIKTPGRLYKRKVRIQAGA